MQNIKLTKNQFHSLQHCFSLEWLESNALGGYSSSTILNGHTRRYHGLLVTAVSTTAERFVLLSNIEDIFIQNDKSSRLTAYQFPNYIEPGAFDALIDFELNTHPIFRYQLAETIIIKEIIMVRHENTVLIKYTINTQDDFELKIRPFLAMRNFHNLRRADESFMLELRNTENQLCISSSLDLPNLYFQTNHKTNFTADTNWYYQFEYMQEQNRGFDCHEDLLTPGIIHFIGKGKTEFIFSCSTELQKSNLTHKFQQEQKYRQSQKSSQKKFPLSRLETNALQFLIKPETSQFLTKPETPQNSLIAGYHWFGEWGRDTMISLPGLTLASGKEHESLAILQRFAAYEKQGIIPNFIGKNAEETAYDSVDTSLWFCWAVQQYITWTKNYRFIKKYIWPALKNIITSYQLGTLYDIKMQDNGLISAGNPKIKLTWMDAVVHQQPITPRNGAAVEVNALWYNALCFIQQLAQYYEDPIAAQLAALMKLVKTSFCEVFWNESKSCLYDFVNANENNEAIRPNQIFAISLPFSPLSPIMAKKIVTVVTEHLLTPYGLRTLSPQDPHYIGQCSGDAIQRDSAYHMGTVWPWLLGHYGTALLKTISNSKEVVNVLAPCFTALKNHLYAAGLGTISEIFDGDAPHAPQGAISQAWSVAEFIRLSYLIKTQLGIDITQIDDRDKLLTAL
jgi:predicted glycogen debranching enzyme